MPIRPIRFIIAKMLPKVNNQNKKVRRTFTDDWKPVLSIMHDGAKLLIGNTPVGAINASFIEETFNAALTHLESKFPNLFEGENAELGRQWKVATWSKKVRAEKRAQKN